MKECLKKRGLDVRKVRRIVQNRCEWRGFVRGNAWGVDAGVLDSHSNMKPLKGGSPYVA